MRHEPQGFYNPYGMADVAAIWAEALPEVRRQVTGVGVWAAVNACKPVALEDGFIVLGLSFEDSELSGHLRVPQTKRVIETLVSAKAGTVVSLRVIDGTAQSDWEAVKRRDLEARRLQVQAMEKAKAEVDSRSSWEGLYEQLNRKYAATQNKSMPQNRALFYMEAIEMVAHARREQGPKDELSERNFARCIERLSQYSEIPSTIVAMHILEREGE